MRFISGECEVQPPVRVETGAALETQDFRLALFQDLAQAPYSGAGRRCLVPERPERRQAPDLALKERKQPPVPQCYPTPQPLRDQNGPAVSKQIRGAIMLGHQQQLVPRDAFHYLRMPPPQRSATLMHGHRSGDVHSGETLAGRAQAEIHVLEIGLESLVQPADPCEQVRAEQGGGKGSKADRRGAAPEFAIRAAMAGPPGAGAARELVVSAIERAVTGGAQEFAGGEPHPPL